MGAWTPGPGTQTLAGSPALPRNLAGKTGLIRMESPPCFSAGSRSPLNTAAWTPGQGTSTRQGSPAPRSTPPGSNFRPGKTGSFGMYSTVPQGKAACWPCPRRKFQAHTGWERLRPLDSSFPRRRAVLPTTQPGSRSQPRKARELGQPRHSSAMPGTGCMSGLRGSTSQLGNLCILRCQRLMSVRQGTPGTRIPLFCIQACICICLGALLWTRRLPGSQSIHCPH